MKREIENCKADKNQQIEFKINEESKEIFEKKLRKSQMNLPIKTNNNHDIRNSIIGTQQPMKFKKRIKFKDSSKLSMADKICETLRSQWTLPERKSNSNFACQGIKGDIRNSNQNFEIRKAWRLVKISDSEEYEEVDVLECFEENTKTEIHDISKLESQESDEDPDEEPFKESSTFSDD